MVPATSGLSPLRDFHSIEFRPADIPVWLNASRERLLRATRQLRLRLRCQREKRCRSKVRHKCRTYHRPGSLASGGQDCGRCPLRVQDPQTCFRLPHCLGRFAPCGFSRPPALRRADYRLTPVIVLPLWFFVFSVVVVRVVWNFIYQKGSGYSVVLLLLVFLYHISRQEDVIPLYIVLVLLRIWRLLIIPSFAEILVLRMRAAVQALRCRALTTGESISAVRRLRKRSASLQKPPKASFQGCQEFIGLISVGGAATEESTAAAAAG